MDQSLAYRYREVAVKTANPIQLVVMLYDAAICAIQEAKGHIENKNIAARSKAINKCVSILTELQSCLDRNAGGEIASSLDRLYDYMKKLIFRANYEQSAQPLEEAEALLENLRSAWRELLKQTSGSPSIAAGQPYPGPAAMNMPAGKTPTPTHSFNVSI